MVTMIADSASAQPQRARCESLDPAMTATGISAWTKAAGEQRGAYSVLELVPSGQTNKDWTDMMTIQTFGENPALDLRGMIGSIASGIKAACPSLEILTEEITPFHLNLMLLCRNPDASKAPPTIQLKKFEVMWLKGVRGQDNSFLVQRAWHGDAPDTNSVVQSAATRKSWQAWADSVGVCGKPCSSGAPNPCLPPGIKP